MKLDKPYVISVYAIIRNQQGEFLLLRRAENSHSNPGKWDLPGGKLGPQEPLTEAVVREVWEETGITAVVGEIAGYTTFELPQKRVIAIIFNGGYVIEDIKLSYEHIEYSWVSLDNVLELDTLPIHFREFFKRFAEENEESSEMPI